MSAPHYVARTAQGLSHQNTLVFRKLWTVVVFLDRPEEDERIEDSYQLLSDDGFYDQTLQRTEAVHEGDNHLALHFTEVVPIGTYSLFHVLSSAIQIPIFLSVPFNTLENHGEETPEPENETRNLPT